MIFCQTWILVFSFFPLNFILNTGDYNKEKRKTLPSSNRPFYYMKGIIYNFWIYQFGIVCWHAEISAFIPGKNREIKPFLSKGAGVGRKLHWTCAWKILADKHLRYLEAREYNLEWLVLCVEPNFFRNLI